jgi:hypothetical protein
MDDRQRVQGRDKAAGEFKEARMSYHIYKVDRSHLYGDGEVCEAPHPIDVYLKSDVEDMRTELEECQAYRCQQKDVNNSQVRQIAQIEAEVKTLKHIIIVDNEKDQLDIRIKELEGALREVRRLGQHHPARGIIDKALGDTWEEETGYTHEN